MLPRLHLCATPAQPVNEIGRYVVHSGQDHDRHVLAITASQTADGIAYEAVMAPQGAGQGFPVAWPFSVVYSLCDGRAALTLDGSVRVYGARVTPERYLSLWDQAFAAPMTPKAFHAETGLRLVSHFQGEHQALAGLTSSWTDCPHPNFTAWLSSLGQEAQVTRGHVVVNIDLSQAGGWEQARWASSYFGHHRLSPDVVIYASLHFHPQAMGKPLASTTLEAA